MYAYVQQSFGIMRTLVIIFSLSEIWSNMRGVCNHMVYFYVQCPLYFGVWWFCCLLFHCICFNFINYLSPSTFHSLTVKWTSWLMLSVCLWVFHCFRVYADYVCSAPLGGRRGRRSIVSNCYEFSTYPWKWDCLSLHPIFQNLKPVSCEVEHCSTEMVSNSMICSMPVKGSEFLLSVYTTIC